MKTIDNITHNQDIKTHLETQDGDGQRIFKLAGVGAAGGTILKTVKAYKLALSEKVDAEVWQCRSTHRPELMSQEDVIADATSKGLEAKPAHPLVGGVQVIRSRTPYTSWRVEVTGCGMSVCARRPAVCHNAFILNLGGHDTTSPEVLSLLDSSDAEFEANIQASIKSWR